MRSHAIAIVTLLLLAATGTAWGQFTTVINVPGDPAPASISSGTQVNVLEGGILNSFSQTFTASGGEVNLLGGTMNGPVQARGSSVFNLLEGRVSTSITVADQSVVNVGGIDYRSSLLTAANSSRVHMSGSEIERVTGLDNATFTLSGGRVSQLTLRQDATATMEGGILDGIKSLNNQSSLEVTGGTFRGRLLNPDDGLLTLHGGEFRIDGIPVAGLNLPGQSVDIELAIGQFVTGTLPDGRVLGFSQGFIDSTDVGTLRLVASPLPSLQTEIHLPGDSPPVGLREGRTLHLGDGASVGDYFTAGWNSTLIMTGGSLGEQFHAYHATVRIRGGEVGTAFTTAQGSIVDITGGNFAGSQALGASQVDIDGGTFGFTRLHSKTSALIQKGEFKTLTVDTDSDVLMSGGRISERLYVGSSRMDVYGGLITGVTEIGSGQLTLHGGRLGGTLLARAASQVEIVGGDFRVDGVPVAGLDAIGDIVQFDPASGVTVTGILTDGTPIHLSSDDGRTFAAGTLNLRLAPVPGSVPSTLLVLGKLDRHTLREGQKAFVSSKGELGDYFRSSAGAEITFNGGSLGHHFEGDGTKIVVNSGTIGDYFNGFVRTELLVSGGTVGNHARLSGESRLEMTAGSLGNSFYLQRGSTAIIHGGTVGSDFRVVASTATIHGGTFGASFQVGTPPPPPRGGEGEGEAAAIVIPASSIADIHAGSFQNIQVNKSGIANIDGGTFEKGLVVREGTANLSGGVVQTNAHVTLGGTLNVFGGSLPDDVQVTGAVLNLYGGSIGERLRVDGSGVSSSARSGELHVYGGEIGQGWRVSSSAIVSIQGGTFGEGAHVEGGVLTIYGTAFDLDPYTPSRGKDFPELLTPNVPYLITTRNVTLTVRLLDGSPFELGLFNTPTAGRDFVSARANVYLVLVQVPEPGTLALALISLATLAFTRCRPAQD